MATFIGTEEEFNLFIMPSVRNWVQTLTKPYKRKLDNICQHCGEKHELQAAHVHGRERKAIVHSVLEDFEKDGIYQVDLDVFKEKVLDAHNPVEENFLFLCQKCHREYDNDILNYSHKTAPSRQSNSHSSNVNACDGIDEDLSYDLPESDLFEELGIEKMPGESLQDHVKRIFSYLMEHHYLSVREIERLKTKEYSNRVIGLNDAFLSETRWFDGHNRSRSWSDPIYGYYLCSEWNKRRFNILEPNFRRWTGGIIRVGKASMHE